MTDADAPTLHVVTPPRHGTAGVPVGELLYASIAAAQRGSDAVLLFGDSEDRRAAESLGVREIWLARKPADLGARRIIAGTARDAARRLARAQGPPASARVRCWSPELGFLRAEPVETAPHELAAASLARLPSRGAARAALGLDDEPTLAPLSASPAHVDARALAFVSGVLDLLGHHHTVLIPTQGKRLEEALRFIRRTELHTRVLMVGPPLLRVLPAADVLVEPEYDDADLDTTTPHALRLIAKGLGLPVAPTTGWDTEQGLGHGNLPPEIVATVGPAVRAFQAFAPTTPASPRLR